MASLPAEHMTEKSSSVQSCGLRSTNPAESEQNCSLESEHGGFPTFQASCGQCLVGFREAPKSGRHQCKQQCNIEHDEYIYI